MEKLIMCLHSWGKYILALFTALLVCSAAFANMNLFLQAKALQRDGKLDDAVLAYRNFLSQPMEEDAMTEQQMFQYTEALVQLMNTYQSKGEPEACVQALQEVFKVSPVLQRQCLRDYYSVMGYALSRTERMKEAEETMLRALALPLHNAAPERYFRDYAYAAAVFYSNPDYQNEVVSWCQAAIVQAGECGNTSGKQWVTAMLGSLYKRNGHLGKALELYQQSKEEALSRNDDLGVLNSLHALIDLFLYWGIPEYADLYASEAMEVEPGMEKKNPMVSAQTYINKARVLFELGKVDSVSCYLEQARSLCQSLPYNSGMVDVELLSGTMLTTGGGDSLLVGIQELRRVAKDGTAVNRAKAYHQLAMAYMANGSDGVAGAMLDSVYSLLNGNGATIYIPLDYELILNHYLKCNNRDKLGLFAAMMFKERQALRERQLNFNLVESVVELQMEQKVQEQRIVGLKQTNQRLWLFICIVISVVAISGMVAYLLRQKRRYAGQMKQADERVTALVEKLNKSNAENEMRVQEIDEYLKKKDNRQELETLTPYILKTDGEAKFRQCFELLYPLFLPRLRERVPSITRREELLSMLIVLKLDNRGIAELLAVAPRSVLMLRHRFRQKIGMATESPLEDFIEEILR